MRSTLRVLVAAALGVLAAVLVACGGGRGLLGGTEGNDLANRLDDVSNAVAAKDCASARKAAAQLRVKAGRLPATVDPRLRRSLFNGASTVASRASAACRPKAKTTTTSVPTTTTTQTTTTLSTSTSTPSTQSTSTSTPSTQSTSTSTPSTSSSTSTTPSTSTGGTTSTSGGAGPGTP